MKIRVNPRNAMRIYLATFLMILAGIGFGAVTLYRHFSEPEGTQVAPRGEISVTVEEVQNPTPTASTSASSPATSATDTNKQDTVTEERGWLATVWAWTWRLGIILLLLCLAGLLAENAFYRFILKTDPMPKFKDYKFKPWNVPGWIWDHRWGNKEDKKEEKDKPASDDKKKKSKDRWYSGSLRIVGAIFKWVIIVTLVMLMVETILNFRVVLARVQQVNQSITGKTIPSVDRLLAQTAPDENLRQAALPPEQQNPRAISWITTENLPSKAGIVTTAPRSFRTDYIMSDETAFLIYMKDTTAGGEIIIKLRHNRSGELFGWWERIGGPGLEMGPYKPSWTADRMPDGSFYLRLQDEKVPTLFEQLRIVKK